MRERHLLPVTGSRYRYTSDLLALDSCRTSQFLLPSPRFAVVVTPLMEDRWQAALGDHPDKEFASYIVEGIRSGFRVGFRGTPGACKPAARNMPSASQCERSIDEFVASECAAGRILGPFERSFVPTVHLNRLGAVPKSTPGKYRLIVDLSYPSGGSVNDGITGSFCSLSYVSVESAAQTVLRLGRGTLLAKMDIRDAYRNIPVHPDDRWLLGISWRGGVFVDTVLPFGLRSAPKIFNAVADALEWIVRKNGVRELCHYLDDFLVLGSPGSEECAWNLSALVKWAEWLGFPLALEKVEGPSTTITFLGVEIDTSALILRLPEEKLVALRRLISSWRGRTWCRKTELQSLAGKLQHACKVVRPGRSFLRRVFELLGGVHRDHYHVKLNGGMRSDLAWWDLFLESWNGVSMLHPSRLSVPDHEIYTDASGAFGSGALWGHHWFQLKWPLAYTNVAIAPKELVPIVVACVVWGRSWQGHVVHVHSDNTAVVSVINSGYSKDSQMMHLTRCLFFILAAWDISLYACHIPGVLNTVADAISRDNVPLLFSKVPNADRRSTPVPAHLIELLLTQQPDWTLPSWRRLFSSCLQQV